MKNTIFLLTIILIICGCTSGPRVHYPLGNTDDTANAFIESVREYYSTRSDGKLTDPSISGDRVRFLYKYNLIKNGKHTEQVELGMHKERTTRSNTGDSQFQPASFTVDAWYQQDGKDPVIPEVREAIISGMKKRIGDFKTNTQK